MARFEDNRNATIKNVSSTLIDAPTTASLVDSIILNTTQNAKTAIIRGLEAGPGVTLEVNDADNNRFNTQHKKVVISAAGWGSLFGLLKYKSELRGGYFHQINQWLPSSKTCNSCGHKKEKLDLMERTFVCNECGTSIHRDLNAARNICDWGRQEFVYRYGDVFAGRQELPPTPLDVIADVFPFVGDQSVITEKEEAGCSLDAW